MLRHILASFVGLSVLHFSTVTLVAASFSEGFNGLTPVGDVYRPVGWTNFNRSENASVINAGYWLPSSMLQVPVASFEGDTSIGINMIDSVITFSPSSTISVWLVSPVHLWENGDQIKFATFSRNPAGPPQDVYPDRMQVRLSQAGASVDVGSTPYGVGDFSKLLLDINPTYAHVAPDAYPTSWTVMSATVSGLSSPMSGRLAFRYFVEDGGWEGNNSCAIQLDDLFVTSVHSVPEPSTACVTLAISMLLLRRRATECKPK